ncbi:MAG: mannose-1-phosphate guanylyltransferase/mannose-6-phosphate isomerase [Desulfatitalea sp.]|nr:mannose-1-phosphate guanylyltransferase/mannose-6-phosphate isomerase [Desulfatitalea sp.]
MTITPVILAGGSGTRLWPLSRSLYPKQFMALVDEHTLLQSTMERLLALEGVTPPILLCNEAHRFIVAEQVRQMGVTPAAIVLEPAARNTAPALTVAALLARIDDNDPILLALPADHHIRDIQGFVDTVRKGAAYAGEGRMVTFGITPDAPETGYGYIRKGNALDTQTPPAWAIDRFVEKPDRDTARRYVDSGEYCWNSGMFMFRAGKLIEEMEQHAPEIVAACRLAVSKGHTDLDFFRLDKAAFAQSPSDSIDYAVMEKTGDGVMVALASDWSDLGSWEALWQAGPKDTQDNVVHGDVCLQDVHRSFVHASSRLVTAVGLDNHVVVETKDAVFVAPRHSVQQVKALVDQLKATDRSETVTHRDVYRPWGTYEDIDVSERFLVKRITVKPQAKLSLQRHMHRAEHWVVVKGTALVTRGEEQFLLKEDQSTYIPLGTVHRLENPGKILLELVEIQSGSYLAEDDVVRLDDVYGRHNGGEEA